MIYSKYISSAVSKQVQPDNLGEIFKVKTMLGTIFRRDVDKNTNNIFSSNIL